MRDTRPPILAYRRDRGTFVSALVAGLVGVASILAVVGMALWNL